MEFLIGLVLAVLIPFLAWKKGSLTAAGSALSGGMVLVCALNGLSFVLLMILSFAAVTVVEHLLRPRFEAVEAENVLKTGARDAVQVLANGGWGILALIFYRFTGADWLPLLFAASLAEALGDTVASSAGIAAGGTTWDICRFRRMPVGQSGGVSLAGTLSCLAACAFVGIAALTLGLAELSGCLVVILSAFAGCLADSVLGSLVQRKNRCPVCGAITEKNLHCGRPTVWHKGLHHLNNDGVNALSNLFAVLLVLFLH